MDIWTRAGNIGNTSGPGHVLDSGIRTTIWPEGVANGWYDAEIIRKDAGTWPWTQLAADNIPGEKAYDWNFVLTDDGTTITVTWTQTSNPANTFTLTATDTTHSPTNYVAFTAVNGYLNDITISAEKPEVGFRDDFEKPHDYLTEGLGTYDGMLNGTIEVLDANTSRPGALYMQSANAIWDPGPGPLLYVKVTGDFVATVKVTDFAGNVNEPVYHNDAGIIARNPASDRLGVENWVSINYFPTWTAFNARSTVDGVREENGQPAGSWEGVDTFALAAQYPYIQLERKGSDFYFRISEDGVNFIPLTYHAPDEPYQGIYDGSQTPLVISRPDLPGMLQVGLMGCTYTESSGYVAFDDFSITMR
jgi:regulation of enolase protein 1 (concanavalin A-like superfamily)